MYGKMLGVRPVRIRIFISMMAIAASMCVPAFSHADALLGAATDYNVFVLGDMNVTSDTQGRIAAGGNFSASNYSVGSLSTPASYSLVAGGNVSFGPGTVYQGGIYSGGNITLNNYSVGGDVIAQGTVTRSGGAVSGTVQAVSSLASPVDFTAAGLYLKGLSQDLRQWTPNGTTTYSYGDIKLSGTHAVNVFNILGNDPVLRDLDGATSLHFDFAADGIAIVNVSGTSCDFGPMAMLDSHTGTTWSAPGNILFNFYEATSLNIHNVNVTGSILAPYADVVFNSGQVNGTVVADSILGCGQYNLATFDHEIPGSQPVPEPGTLLLLGSGLSGLAAVRFGKKRSRS